MHLFQRNKNAKNQIEHSKMLGVMKMQGIAVWVISLLPESRGVNEYFQHKEIINTCLAREANSA